MRIRVTGDTESSRVIRAYLAKAGVAVSERLPKFALSCTIHLSEHSGQHIIVDSVDSLLELHILRHITENITSDVILRRRTGIVSSENEIHLSIPAGDPEAAHAVELGVLRGVQRAHFHRPWYRRLLPVVALGLLLPSLASAQYQTSNTVTRPFSGAPTGSCNSFQFAVDTTNGDFYNCLFSAWHKISSGAGASSFDLLTTGVNVTATMTVGTGATLTFSGSGVNNASQINGVTVTGTPATGKIPIATSSSAAVWADPVVSGPDANAGAPAGNPLVTAGWDGTSVRRYLTDTTGILKVNVTAGLGNCTASTVNAHQYCGNNTASNGVAPGFIVPVLGDIAASSSANAYTLTGEAAAGNIALKQASADHTQYVSTSGSDSNDGLSWGTAKLTPLAAINTATNTGTNGGLVYVACGTYPGPTAASLTYFHLSIISMCAATMQDFAQVGGTAITAQTVFTYSAGISLAPVDQRIIGISFDFQTLGGGVTFTNGTFLVDWSYVNIHECGNTTTPCLQFQTTGSTGGASNIAVNTFDHLRIKPNTLVGQFAECIVIAGSGPVNAGTFATDLTFSVVNCSGNLKTGIRTELNSDTNYFRDVQFGQQLAVTPANSAVLAFNTLTPASDQDADGGLYDGISWTGVNSTSFIRAGQSNGNWIKATAAGTPSITVLGGNPQMSVQIIGLAGIQSNFWTNGTFSATANANIALPAGMIAGDMGVARTATSAAFYMGNDGGSIFRSGNGLIFTGANGSGGYYFSIPEGALATGTTGSDNFWPDSVEHNFVGSMNNNGLVQRWSQTAVLHTAYTNATTTFSNVSDGTRTMSWAVAASRDYTVSCDITYQSSATTAGPKFQITGPASPTAVNLRAMGGTGAAAFADAAVTAFSTPLTTFGTAGATATNFVVRVTAGIVNGSTAGTVTLQAAANGVGTVTFATGTSCVMQ